jgi:iron(III) transport system permease protein
VTGKTEHPTAGRPAVSDRSDNILLGLAGVVAVAVLLPLSWMVIVGTEVGLDNLLGLLFRNRTLQILLNSILLTTLVTVASVLLAVPLAYLTTRTNLPFRRTFTVTLSLPLVIPSYIGAFAFDSTLNSGVGVSRILEPLGLAWLPELTGLTGSVLVITLYTYPYVFITTRAALKSMDTRLVDAARTLRHTRWQAFRRVTLPQILPSVTAGSLLVALYALSDFGTPSILVYDVFTRMIYVEYNSFGTEMAAVLSLVLVTFTVIVLAVERWARGSGRVQSDRGHTGDQRSVIRLGRWRWPAIIPCLAVSGLALIVPLAILTIWLLGGTEDVAASMAFQFEYVVNSVGIAALAAVAAGLAGLPIAHLSARAEGLLPNLFERASYVGYAVPGVVVGLSLVFLGARYGGSLYQQGLLAFPLLVFAYVVRFLPQAVGSTRAAVLRVSPALPEAARTLGRSPLGSFRSITLPLIAPGQLAGAALVFLTTIKELPATLLLRPAGFDTLVTHVWRAEQAGHFGQAALPALVLLLVSSLSMLVILAMEGYDVE